MARSVLAAAALCVVSFGPAQAADVEKGERGYRKCSACHSLTEGDNRVGPHLFGIVGREAASVDGFGYSDALASSGWTWDEETLTAFLTNPKKALPGNKMSFRGIRKPEDIENLIAYLATQN